MYRSEACQDEGKILHLRMMLWLAVYEQLYERKVRLRICFRPFIAGAQCIVLVRFKAII